MSVTSWFLVSSGGTRHRLPREMIFVGRDDCELMLQSRSVDKQHAVINYEPGTDEHKVKDLGSLNGTFVNDVRIQEQMYITLKLEDKLRFGYDTNLFTVVRGELTVPEEALKHEKFTIGLQLSKKPSTGETASTTATTKSPSKTPTKAHRSPSHTKSGESKVTDGVTSSKESSAKPVDTHKAEERIGGDITALPRGTPLYGQPSWWGDGDADDENSFKQENRTSTKKHDSSTSESKEAHRGEKAKEGGLHAPTAHDSSYFEIPTKEGHMASNGIHEIPTKDTEGTASHITTAQGHASFTIEFDNTSPGKVTIKDHVSKFTPDHHRSRSKKSGAGSGGAGGRDLSTLQAAMMASESKVADWLAQNDPTLVRSESTEDDSKSSKSIKSDVPVHLKRLKGSKHEDGTQSDSENGLGLRFANRRHALEERLKASHSHVGAGGSGETGGGNITVSGTRTTGTRTAFMIEFYDEENPRKRRSYSFSQTAPLLGAGVGGEGLCPQPPSHPKVFSISTSATTASDSGKVPAPIPATVTVGAPTAARVLLKQRSEDPSIGRSSASTGLATGSPTTPSEDTSIVGRGASTAGVEAEDDHSDKGTYTIELENKNPEEEEARRMIDKVFGVQQNKDSSILSDLKGEGKGKEAGQSGKEALPGDSSWVSQWASIAANHTRTDPEGSGAETGSFLHKERGANTVESGASLSRGESSSSLTDRKRRTLPQLPVDDSRAKSATQTLRSEIGEKQDTEPQEKENKGDGESPTPMENSEMTSKRKQSSTSSPSKASLRTSGSTERRKKSEERKGGGAGEGSEKSGKPLVRQGSFTIEKPSASVPAELIPRINRGCNGRERSDSVGSMDTATLLKDTEAVMAFLEAKLRDENKLDQKSSKAGITAQGSSSALLPRTDSISPESDVDTASTASHVAESADKKAAASVQKRRSLSSMHREKSNMSTASKTSITNPSARERLERKTKSRPVEATTRTDARRSVQPSSASSRARQPSADLTDDDQTSSFPISDILSSDQETYSGPLGHSTHGRGSDDVLQSKLDRSAKTSASGSSKTSRTLHAATASSLSKQASLPQPRPTRASLLRRARLGDTSDTDLADADRVSVASEVSTTSSTSKPPSGRKGMSRLDLLAQPRRNRLGSISARSDSECTVTRSSTSSPRLSSETALRLGLRSSTPTENKLTPRMRANSVSKLNEAKSKTTTAGYCSPTVSSSSRWRRLPPEYGSTSEEEFGSNRNSPKRPHVRPHHIVPHRNSRLGATVSPVGVTGPGGVGIKHRMKEQEEYIRDWTAHSEEIARISQDLAKDLAILAREIHDVAGEIDSVSSSGTAPSTTVSTAATTPGSAIDTREELVDRVFDESLNFRKIPPVISTSKPPEINGKPAELRPRAPDNLEPRALRRRTWNREEAVLDSLLLHSVSQLSTKIRHSIDKTAGKIRILFKDKDRNWDEIESKLRSESEVPLLKTSNKEISGILLELKRVEKQLQVINVMVDPDGTLDALASLSLTSPTTPTKPQAAKTTPPSATSPGSAPPAKESLPEILPGSGGSAAASARVQTSSASTEEKARDTSIGLGKSAVGGLSFSRIRPSGEEAIAQK
ncbi:centrosomal protein of 170 kDa isoform X5 [Maylandia zebra]|uniref:centrosomal protein of 170 kDa isoform X5 n=1 Tax=Maylandia zebra TaxID=106582 RepID=UPI000D3081D2|nr:centrosomal protein of 170 kDa isoform X5 [Maylandia zebra]XP_026045303.1 centrosomal protein of 170 kDa isoform X7 [Astatotilapia calliptera]